MARPHSPSTSRRTISTPAPVSSPATAARRWATDECAFVMRRPSRPEALLLLLAALALLSGVVLVVPPRGPRGPGPPPSAPPTATPAPQVVALPRGYGVAIGFGYGTAADLDQLGPAWYYDYGAGGADWPRHPRVLMVRPAEGADDETLRERVLAHPGHWWMLGNEPNDPHQDNLDIYAYTRYFAHTAARIRALDPTAGIMPAGLANADTRWAAALRAEYMRQTGQPLQVDAWN